MQTTFYQLRLALLVLVLVNGPACLAQFGGTLSMNGADQTVSAPNGMLNGATVFTIEFWVKTTESRSNGTYWQRPTLIGTASSGGPSGDFGITTDNGYIGMWSGLNNGGDNAFLSNSIQINNNAWHHIAAVNNSSIITLYVDGNSAGSISSGMGIITGAAPLTVGGSSLDFSFSGNVGTTNFFHQGVYDEIRFSNSVRYTANFTVPAVAFTAAASTIALYQLDGCVNGLVPDASPNTNNGHPHNFSGSCALVLPPVPTIPATPALPSIIKAAYFFDTDPGFESGTDLPVTGSTDVSTTTAINLQTLATGSHRLYLRTKDAAGSWSITNSSSFFIVPNAVVIPSNPTPGNLVKSEYYFDQDPGFGNAMAIPAGTPAADITFHNAAISLTGLSIGTHNLFIRTQDAAGSWSMTNHSSFFIVPAAAVIPANPVPANILRAEYYLDSDPGFGNGNTIPVGTPATDITLSNIAVNITRLSNGVHYLYVRTQDAQGRWSITNNQNFSIVAANVVIPANPVPGNLTKLEYFFDTDPGFGNGTAVSFSPVTDLSNFSFAANTSSLTDGQHTLYIRSFDGWSITNTQTFIKGTVLPLTWLSFSAKAMADSVLLQWKTAGEINNHHFDIERSNDGNTFNKLASVNADAMVTATHDYHFTDLQPLPGISYYRIKQVDKDGKVAYSMIIAVRYSKQATAVTIYPNPAKDRVTILFGELPAKNTVAELRSMNGQLLKTMTVGQQAYITIPVADLPDGVYELHIKGDGLTVLQKVIVQH